MTPQERDEKIVSILTKICINVLVKNLFDINGVRVYEEVLHELNQLPVNEEEYTRCNHAHMLFCIKQLLSIYKKQ
jgi:hypothetical protein